MKRQLYKALVPIGALMVTAGCVDNNYDLSDIDTTSEIKLTNLVLPVNVDEILLDNIIDLEEDSKIKTITIDGKQCYAVTEEGKIESDAINVPGFTAAAPTIEDSKAKFLFDTSDLPDVPAGVDLPEQTIVSTYHFESFDPQKIDVTADDVDKSIVSVDEIDVKPMKIKVQMIADLAEHTTLNFKKMDLQFLPHLIVTKINGVDVKTSANKYNWETGELVLTDIKATDAKGHIIDIVLDVNGLVYKSGNQGQSYTFGANRQFKLSENATLKSADLETVSKVKPNEFHGADVNFTVKTTVEDIQAEYFTGVVKYALEGDDLNIEPITLNDIPDFLNDPQTRLSLANPQIYLGFQTDPVAQYGLYFQTGLEIQQVEDNGTRPAPLKLDNPAAGIKLFGKDIKLPANYVLCANSNSLSVPEEYKANLSTIGFASLGDVLTTTNGMPKSLEINLVDPQLPEQQVTKFKLGSDLEPLKGTYYFLAPLALKTGENAAKIVYSDVADGWGSEDLDKLTINEITINADVTSTIPFSAEITALPINEKGEVIKGCTMTISKIDALAKNQPVVVKAAGDIKDFDGLKFSAIVVPGSEEALSPDQTLKLTNIRLRVSGSYTTDF